MHLSARFNTAIVISISIDARGRLAPASSGLIPKATIRDATKRTRTPARAHAAWLGTPKGINLI